MIHPALSRLLAARAEVESTLDPQGAAAEELLQTARGLASGSVDVEDLTIDDDLDTTVTMWGDGRVGIETGPWICTMYPEPELVCRWTTDAPSEDVALDDRRVFTTAGTGDVPLSMIAHALTSEELETLQRLIAQAAAGAGSVRLTV